MNAVSSYACFVSLLASERPTKTAFAGVLPWCVRDLPRLARGGFAIVVLIIGATTASAQTSKLPDPADPGSAAPAVKYESAFSDYQPFQEQKSNSWNQVNKEVADNPGMGSMKDMAGKTMPGMDSKTAEQTMRKQGGGHDMDSMKDMPGMDKQAAAAPVKRKNADEMAMAKPDSAPGPVANAQAAGIIGTGVVLGIDKANGKVKLTHEPIAALGWPKMTMFFRLKDSALADQVKEGEKVEFYLEKAGSGYVISGFQKGAARHDMKQLKK